MVYLNCMNILSSIFIFSLSPHSHTGTKCRGARDLCKLIYSVYIVLNFKSLLFSILIIPIPHSQARGTGMETVVFERPMDSRLEHVDFSLLFNTLSQRKVIQVFSSLLMERRVILCAQSLSLLSGCAHALLALLYPFEWQVCRVKLPKLRVAPQASYAVCTLCFAARLTVV